MFGHDMLKDLPPGSVMIGGTDPGRFVPTYMIFGESPQPRQKQTRPVLRSARPLYHHAECTGRDELHEIPAGSVHRRAPKANERPGTVAWPRGRIPVETSRLPDRGGDGGNGRIAAIKDQESGVRERDAEIFGVILRWLWEKNRDQHEFFIEESFPIRWTYDYAIPNGLVYRLNKTRLEALPKEVVERDFAYWRDYSARLLGDPNFKRTLMRSVLSPSCARPSLTSIGTAECLPKRSAHIARRLLSGPEMRNQLSL